MPTVVINLVPAPEMPRSIVKRLNCTRGDSADGRCRLVRHVLSVAPTRMQVLPVAAHNQRRTESQPTARYRDEATDPVELRLIDEHAGYVSREKQLNARCEPGLVDHSNRRSVELCAPAEIELAKERNGYAKPLRNRTSGSI
jgi:hypothetical protein